MQLDVLIELEAPLSLPINYRSILQGIIYTSARWSNKAYTDKLHAGFSRMNNFKFFTFSNLKGDYYLSHGRIFFTKSVSFEVRSASKKFIELVYEGMKSCGVNFKGKHYVPRLNLRSENILEESMVIKMCSPLVAHERKGAVKDYLTPLNSQFYTFLQDNYRRKYEAFFKSTAPDVSIEYLSVTSSDKWVTIFKDTYITGWTGYFILKGSKKGLTFLYNTGLGCKNSCGYGLFEIVSSDTVDF